jgi:hypothetical protein
MSCPHARLAEKEMIKRRHAERKPGQAELNHWPWALLSP